MKFKVGDKIEQILAGYGTDAADCGKKAIVIEAGLCYIAATDGIKIKEIGNWKYFQEIRGDGGFKMTINTERSGKKLKVGDKILCIETPTKAHKPNIKKGLYAVMEKAQQTPPGSTSSSLRLRILGKTGKPTKKTYAYWAEDSDCYVLPNKLSDEERLRLAVDLEVGRLKRKKGI